MEIREYFNQDKYFSESTQELMSIDEMAFPHAFNAWWKLCSDYSMDFYDTRLNRAFMERLSPSAEKIREQLRRYGVASHVYFGSTTNVRSKFYSAAKVGGMKVTTHKEKNYVTASVVTDTHVHVKGSKIA